MANSVTKTKSSGLARIFSRYYFKMVREKATPEYIAGGWALGMFCGCIIPMGGQLIISVPLSFLLRLSKIGATLGTLITNHFTILFIYPFQCWLGLKVLGRASEYDVLIRQLRNWVDNPTWKALRELGGDIMVSFFIGGFILALICTPLTYLLVRRAVIRYRATLEKRREFRARLLQKLHHQSVKQPDSANEISTK